MSEDFEFGLILDRMISSMTEPERICAIWNFFELSERRVLRFPQLSAKLSVVRATELMVLLEGGEKRERWAEKHVSSIMEAVGDVFLNRMKDESAPPRQRVLCGMWLLRDRVIRSRHITGLLSDNNSKLTNVANALIELCDDSFIDLVEGDRKKSSENEFELNRSGFKELKSLLYREGFQKGES